MSRATIIDPATESARPLDPSSRQRRPIPDYDAGVVLSDGRTWVLARTGLAPVLAAIRDRLCDHSILFGEVEMGDILQAAWVCLLAHYDLTAAELAGLLSGLTDEQEEALVQATSDAVLGPNRPFRTHTDRAVASLHANGLDPEEVPPVVPPDVLDLLVRTGRTAPEDEWIESAIAIRKRARLANVMRRSTDLANGARPGVPAGPHRRRGRSRRPGPWRPRPVLDRPGGWAAGPETRRLDPTTPSPPGPPEERTMTSPIAADRHAPAAPSDVLDIRDLPDRDALIGYLVVRCGRPTARVGEMFGRTARHVRRTAGARRLWPPRADHRLTRPEATAHLLERRLDVPAAAVRPDHRRRRHRRVGAAGMLVPVRAGLVSHEYPGQRHRPLARLVSVP